MKAQILFIILTALTLSSCTTYRQVGGDGRMVTTRQGSDYQFQGGGGGQEPMQFSGHVSSHFDLRVRGAAGKYAPTICLQVREDVGRAANKYFKREHTWPSKRLLCEWAQQSFQSKGFSLRPTEVINQPGGFLLEVQYPNTPPQETCPTPNQGSKGNGVPVPALPTGGELFPEDLTPPSLEEERPKGNILLDPNSLSKAEPVEI
jgi:hypothetical protein